MSAAHFGDSWSAGYFVLFFFVCCEFFDFPDFCLALSEGNVVGVRGGKFDFGLGGDLIVEHEYHLTGL